MSEFWSNCLSRLEQELPAQQFNTWIKPLRLEGSANPEEGLRLFAPNGFILKWVRDRYLSRIEEFGREFFNTEISIDLTIGQGSTPVARPAPVVPPLSGSNGGGSDAVAPGASELPASASRPAAALKMPSREKTGYEKTRLNAAFTFDNLVVGKANDLARAAAMRVAENPGSDYNPLFIYGGAGLGKTHLIHAIGNRILADRPDKVLRYVHAEDYYQDVVRAYQQKSFDVFKRYYRSVDVLLIDDVQFLNGKNRTQEEFFYAFNALMEAKKQIIITCDTYPKDITGLEDRLITRFDWGLTVQIEPPEMEMRVAILEKKAEAEGVRLDKEVAFFIAKHLKSNVRELEGALKKVLAYSQFHGRAIGLDMAKEALKDVIGAYNRQITVENIQKTVAEYYKIKVADLYSKKRTRIIARPRQVAMWLAKDLTPHSYPAIGDAFGGRDHTTVLHAVRTIEDLKMKDNQLNHDLHVLLQVLKG
ncbi:chromosomal replication iniciator protein [Oryzomicrobium terrae]|uniref:Chromosomal replication initiator protein DnaA n=1 Tax=Oryzomicrobium terrae TaxID=1735038 RepID=A0A5C1E5C3_9RHOO|nr:chromosomal replication initiator protein DnaA [Oryzomicrobium terrae]QEL63477.1 chromosomal replication iniciator protein [Oryzomicrobium terrae]